MRIRDCAESVVDAIPQAPSGSDVQGNRAEKNVRSALLAARMPPLGTWYPILRKSRIHLRSLPVVDLTLNLSEEGMARLRAEAERRQTSVDAVVEEWGASLPTKARRARSRQPSFVALGASTSGRRASEADQLLAELIDRGGERPEIVG